MKINLTILFISVLFFSSCGEDKPDDIICDNAIIKLCNPTSDQIVVYGWSGNQITDTLFPGECELKDVGRLEILYHEDGSLKSSNSGSILFHSNRGSAYLGITDCFWEVAAPGGYINIAHCYNGVFNPEDFELGLDCGGNCRPCNAFNIPCDTMPIDKLEWSNSSNLLNLNSSFYGGSFNGKLAVRFTFDSGEEFYIAIPDNDLPKLSEQYVIGSEYYKAEAWFTDRWGNNRRNAVENSTFYFIVDSLQTRILQFCEVDFTTSFGSTIQGSGKLKMD